MKKLTDAQRTFAEQNHNLIYGFLHKRRLDFDEWYGIAAMGYLEAVVRWEPERGAFSTFAYCAMASAIGKELTARGRQMRSGITASLDEELWDDGLTRMDILGAPDDEMTNAVFAADLEQATSMLDADQRRMLEMRVQGYSYREIGETYGYTQQWMWIKLDEIADLIQTGLGIEREKDMAQWKWMPHRKKLYAQLAAEGKTTEEIAQALGCSNEIVKEYAAGPVSKPAPAVPRKAERTPAVSESPAQVPLLHTLIRESQELCRKSWESEDDEAVYVLGQLQARLDMAVKLLGA